MSSITLYHTLPSICTIAIVIIIIHIDNSSIIIIIVITE